MRDFFLFFFFLGGLFFVFLKKSSFSNLRTTQKQIIHLSFASWVLAEGRGKEDFFQKSRIVSCLSN